MFKPPKLLHKNGRATRWLVMLRCCETAGPYGYMARRYFKGDGEWWDWDLWEWCTLEALKYDLGWVEMKNSGPRGGKRWHLTPLGKNICGVITKHGAHSLPVLRLLPQFTNGG